MVMRSQIASAINMVVQSSRLQGGSRKVTRITEIPTGVNLEYFLPPTPAPSAATDLVFVGSMDWLPNVDGVLYFVREILPLIRRQRPATTLAIVTASSSWVGVRSPG